jgi:NAD-dependent deacetylase
MQSGDRRCNGCAGVDIHLRCGSYYLTAKPMERSQDQITRAASLIVNAKHLTAFTGAGVSVESGIPPFRGEGGLWSKYDPRMLELDYFLAHPEQSWPILREIFYDHFGSAKPNRAHEVLAAWEACGLLKTLITQNIDSVQWN